MEKEAVMDQKFISFMLERLGGEAAAREEYEKARPVEIAFELPGEVVTMIDKQASEKGVAKSEVVETAVRAYDASDRAPKKKRLNLAPVEKVINDECVLRVLTIQTEGGGSVFMTAVQVADCIDHLDRNTARSTLDRLVHFGKVMLDKRGRTNEYKINPEYVRTIDVLRDVVAGVLNGEGES